MTNERPVLPPLPPLPRDSKDTFTLSVRFTEEQRDLITKAAEMRGWSPTNLLRTAALEKAAHIVNTTTPNRIDYREVARAIAGQVFQPRRVLVPSPESVPGDVVLWDADIVDSLESTNEWEGCLHPVEVSPREKPPAFLQALREAAKFGGTEFLGLLVEACADIAARHQQLPDPVDPNVI
jgi:uncharacterized protein (DUF1778 family)